MSEFEQLYREVILDHYKSPRSHGLLEPCDAFAEGQNPLCGDEIAISMLTEMIRGRDVHGLAAMPKEELLEEVGIPLTPVRLKCALLGLGVLKVALHRAGTPLPEEWAGLAQEPEIG
ncbi:MAG: iron-sulfur cluster assembly scaffold protein [Thermoleophilia bacterium]|nr:iron-sulfur cluster assembly scaffold protein [Thermoleophilia bacterium]